MTDALSFIACLFSGVWGFFTSVEYPGTGMTIAQITIGALVAVLGLRMLFYVFGLGFNSSDIKPTMHIKGGGYGNGKGQN